MTKETGGPAFPTNSTHHDGYYGGLCMTLRDYFAAKAMQGLVGAPQNFPRATIAEHAYLMADSMIAERDKNDN